MLSFCNKLGLMHSNIWRHLFIGQTWWPPRSPSDSPQWPGGPRNLLVWKHSDGRCSRSSSSDRPVIQAPHETGSGLWHELPKHHRDEKINDPTSDFLSHKACWVLWCQVRGLLDITHRHTLLDSNRDCICSTLHRVQLHRSFRTTHSTLMQN